MSKFIKDKNRGLDSKILKDPESEGESPAAGLEGSDKTFPASGSDKKIPDGTKFIEFLQRVDRHTEEMPDDVYRFIVERSPEAIAFLNDDSIRFVNDRFEEISGYSTEEASQISPIQLVHHDDRLRVQEYYNAKIEGRDSSEECSFRLVNKEGGEVWVAMSGEPFTWGGRPVMLIFVKDMTGRNRMEARLIEARKLEALGTLAEGIAHDFNNLLMTIQGYASLALMESGSSRDFSQRIKKIQELVRSGSELTAQLLGFSGTARYEVLSVNLNDIISGASLVVERSNRAVSVHRDMLDNLWAVKADKVQIEQAIMNLLVNAAQSMPGGGDLYIETDNVVFFHGEEACVILGLEPGTYVRLSITDTGVGIDESIQNRIFDPFFMTRSGKGGMNLGLPSAHGIVRAHGGTIYVTSRTGQGARFDVYLPAADYEKTDKEESPVFDNVQKFHGTILIVDDEPYVLEVNRELLELSGYRVFEAQSGREALEIYSRSKDLVDLVVLDMVMPGMSGTETFHGLREIDPDVKVILLSGYSIEGGARELLKERCCLAFIQKPFTLEHLNSQIQEALNYEH
ncbi:MAG: PAS domain S-box protein [Syntrophales bacterium]|nr:PAS domain S-box protein [Syntrophales bacterium]